MDGDSRIGVLPLKSMKIYKRIFRENDISFRYIIICCIMPLKRAVAG
jgi:hypothetical protein